MLGTSSPTILGGPTGSRRRRGLNPPAGTSSGGGTGEEPTGRFTKVNRSLAEGRARFLRRFSDIDSGAACASWSAVLSAIVDGEATADDLARVRPHLRHCSACRATLRELSDGQPAFGALVP